MPKHQLISLEQLWDYFKCNPGHTTWLDPWGRSNNIFIFKELNERGVPITLRRFTLEDGWFKKLKKTDMYKKMKKLPK